MAYQIHFAFVLSDTTAPVVQALNATLEMLDVAERFEHQHTVTMTIDSPRQLTESEISKLSDFVMEQYKTTSKFDSIKLESVTQEEANDLSPPTE